MKTLRLISIGMVAGILITIGWLWGIDSANARAARAGQLANTPTASDEGGAGWQVQGAGGISDEAAPQAQPAALAPNALPTQIPGETLVYFSTADSDATATVVYLTNTDSVAHVVALRGYSYNGVLGYSLNINVAAGGFVRLSSDSIAAAPPPSWSTPAPIITNFTDFTYFASMSLPKGVKAEGYTLFNPGTGTVDPRADQGQIPLRFSTDPASLFMPSVMSVP
jgi:hypothetical protein